VAAWARRKIESMKNYDLKSASYDELYGSEQSAKFDAGLRHTKLTPASVVLDAGCGTGLLIEKIVGRVALAVGTELSRNMLLRARDKLHSFKNKSLIRADADHLPFRDGVFTHVFAITLLQNMPDPEATLQELRRVGGKGSTLIITGLKKKFTMESFKSLIRRVRLKPIALEDKEEIKDYIAVCSCDVH